MSKGVQKLFWIGVSGFLKYNPSSGITGTKDRSIFSFLRKFHSVFQGGWPICILSNRVLGFPLLHNFPSTSFCWFVKDGHSDQCEVVSHLGFNLHFSDGKICWASFYRPMGPLYVLLGEVSVEVLCPFFEIELVVFLVWMHLSSPYILDIKPLSEVSLANVFSHTVGSLSILMCSLALQKF